MGRFQLHQGAVELADKLQAVFGMSVGRVMVDEVVQSLQEVTRWAAAICLVHTSISDPGVGVLRRQDVALFVFPVDDNGVKMY